MSSSPRHSGPRSGVSLLWSSRPAVLGFRGQVVRQQDAVGPTFQRERLDCEELAGVPRCVTYRYNMRSLEQSKLPWYGVVADYFTDKYVRGLVVAGMVVFEKL